MDPVVLRPTGSTGTIVGEANALPEDADKLSAQLVVEAVGATPTISWKIQLSVDGLAWFDARYITDASEAAAVAVITRTAVGQDVIFVLLGDRGWRFFRLNVTANTNVTYRASAYPVDREN